MLLVDFLLGFGICFPLFLCCFPHFQRHNRFMLTVCDDDFVLVGLLDDVKLIAFSLDLCGGMSSKGYLTRINRIVQNILNNTHGKLG